MMGEIRKERVPEMAGRLSTAKSPQQMFGAITKSYYAEKLGVDRIRYSVYQSCLVLQKGRVYMGRRQRC